MFLRRFGGLCALVLLAALPPLVAPPAAQAGIPFFGNRQEEPLPPVVLLARTIDELERSLNETGTVVAKKPDVWGESRMTKHREDVEEELAKRIDKFELLLNASISRSDAAFFANSFALSAALSPGATPPSITSSLAPTASSSLMIPYPTPDSASSDVVISATPGQMRIATRSGDAAAEGDLGFATTGIGLEPTIQLDQLKRYLDHLNALRRLNAGGDTSDAPGYALNLVRIPVSIMPGGETRQGHGAEITITAETHLTPELLPTTFRSLVIQDLVDQLALPVLKLAEARAWEKRPDPEQAQRLEMAKAHLIQAKELAKELVIKATFVRDTKLTSEPAIKALVNQLVNQAVRVRDHLAQVAVRLPESEAGSLVTQFNDQIKKLSEIPEKAVEIQDNRLKARGQKDNKQKLIDAKQAKEREDEAKKKYEAEEKKDSGEAQSATDEAKPAAVDKSGPELQNESGAANPVAVPANNAQVEAKKALEDASKSAEEAIDKVKEILGSKKSKGNVTAQDLKELAEEADKKAATLGIKADKAEQEINKALAEQATVFSESEDIINSLIEYLNTLALQIETVVVEVDEAIAGVVANVPHSSSSARVARYAVPPSRIAEVFGKQELLTIAEAFDRFRQRECAGVVHLSDARGFLAEELQAAYDFLISPAGVSHWECTPILAQALRGGEVPVEQRISVTGGGQAVVPSLAWAVLVESALLNERLNEDVQRVSQDPNCNCSYAGPYVFYHPDAPMEARQAFMDYVRCRWPIHIFALDPVNQQQNIADQFSMRRELQLSAAVALANGSISTSDAMQFTRQISIEQETIALNSTAAAFAHGADTFGWRFFPRFQTAEIEGNATVLFRDLLCGGPNRDQLLRDRYIEPGMRECVALVVMPSFVPHVRFDIRSNWFKLTKPHKTEASMTETVMLSRKFGEMQQLMEFCALEAQNYRPGEIERLYARVEQLSDKMPLQTVYAQVPYENTAGGFELFSSGVTDLGPELIDFYGAPGVGRGRPTQLFLVGKNFSVHETQVIAGNATCNVELLSRDVMKVTIPPHVRTVVCRRQTMPGDDPCVKCRPTGPCGPGCYEAVEVHLATPYGVSGRLLIPLLPGEKSAAQAAAVATAEACAAAAQEVVAGHEGVFHPIAYGWAPEKAEACLLADACGTPVQLCLNEDFIAVEQAGTTPLGSATNLELAAWVEAIGPDGPLGKFKNELKPIAFELVQGKAKIYQSSAVALAGNGPTTDFAARLWEVLAAEPNLARRAVALRIEGFVRPTNCATQCIAPIKLANTLTITLGPCPGSVCAIGACTTGGCPSCMPGAPVIESGSTMGALSQGFAPRDDIPGLGVVPESFPPPTGTYEQFIMEGRSNGAPPIQAAPLPPSPAVSPAVPPSPAPPTLIAPVEVVPVVPVGPSLGGAAPGRASVLIPALRPTLTIQTTTPARVPPPAPAPSKPKRNLLDIFHHEEN